MSLPRFRITTPEQVVFHYNVAGPVARGMAWLFDQMLIWLGYVAIIFVFAGFGGSISIALIILAIFILDFSYFVCFELYSAGQSPGKRLFGIRVISARGNKLRFADVMVRNLLRPIDMLPFAMLLGATVASIDRWHRRLGDLAADTIIIRDVRRELPQALATQKARINSFQTNAALRNRILTRITREERDLIADLALRRDQLDPAAREEIFNKAASCFRTRFALPEDLEYLSDEQTVLNLALVIQEAKFTA